MQEKEIAIEGQKFVTKVSGKRYRFETGAVRESRLQQGRYDLLPPVVIHRYAELLQRGSQKYSDRNWELGMPVSSYLDSALRHLFQLLDGDNSEDHAAAVIFNVGAVIHHRDAIAKGLLPSELDDIPPKKQEASDDKSEDNGQVPSKES
jgi:hypothetical protein